MKRRKVWSPGPMAAAPARPFSVPHYQTNMNPPAGQLGGLIPDPTGGWLKVAAMAAGAYAGAHYMGKVRQSYAPAGAALAVPVAFVVAAYVFD